MSYNPPVYMWIAFLEDGTAIPQYDPETGIENAADPDWLPSRPDQPVIEKNPCWKGHRVIKLGWYPFSPDMAEKILAATGLPVKPTANLPHVLEFMPGDKPFVFKRGEVDYMQRSLKIVGHRTYYFLGKIGHTKIKKIDANGEASIVDYEPLG